MDLLSWILVGIIVVLLLVIGVLVFFLYKVGNLFKGIIGGFLGR